MNAHPYERKLARTLDRMGGLYTVNDILTAVGENRMQAFAEGDSWAVTQVVQFPQKLVMEVLAALGDINECRILHDRILQYARAAGVDLISAYGRRGWIADANSHGWKVKAANYLYMKVPQ